MFGSVLEGLEDTQHLGKSQPVVGGDSDLLCSMQDVMEEVMTSCNVLFCCTKYIIVA